MFLNRFLKSFYCRKYIFRKYLHANNRRTFAWGSFMDSPEKKIIHPNKYDLCGNNTGTKLDYMSSLSIDSETNSLRLSSIICTIGPASTDVKVLESLMDAGMNIARLNLSHGTHEYHSNTVKNIRAAAANYGEKIGTWYPLAIALDTKGPEIRTGLLGGERDAPKEVELRRGEKIRLTTDRKFEKTGTDKQVFVDYANITRIVKEGDSVYIDDGLILLTVSGVGENYVDCTIENGGMLGGQKGVNLPGLDVDLPAVSEKDKADLRFAVEQDLDLVFASFVREASAVHEIRKILGECGERILIVPKIENHQGIKNLQSIIDVSDGIMVARGDLGIEIPPEKVFLAQKSMIARCNANGKPVICATQMLESMVKKPRATRAESSDVANAILDGADCVMLSGETAKGKYPVECVRTMDKLCREAESALWRKELLNDLMSAAEYTDVNQLIAMETVIMANDVDVTAIVVTSSTDLKLAHAIAKYRPLNVILVVTNDRKTARQCHLHRGLLPVFYPPDTGCNVDSGDLDNNYLKYVLNFGKCRGILASGDTVVFVNDSKMDYLQLSDVIYKCIVP